MTMRYTVCSTARCLYIAKRGVEDKICYLSIFTVFGLFSLCITAAQRADNRHNAVAQSSKSVGIVGAVPFEELEPKGGMCDGEKRT